MTGGVGPDATARRGRSRAAGGGRSSRCEPSRAGHRGGRVHVHPARHSPPPPPPAHPLTLPFPLQPPPSLPLPLPLLLSVPRVSPALFYFPLVPQETRSPLSTPLAPPVPHASLARAASARAVLAPLAPPKLLSTAVPRYRSPRRQHCSRRPLAPPVPPKPLAPPWRSATSHPTHTPLPLSLPPSPSLPLPPPPPALFPPAPPFPRARRFAGPAGWAPPPAPPHVAARGRRAGRQGTLTHCRPPSPPPRSGAGVAARQRAGRLEGAHRRLGSAAAARDAGMRVDCVSGSASRVTSRPGPGQDFCTCRS